MQQSPAMSLLVEQIIYTSFPKVGFQSLASQQVPLEIEQAFRQYIVHEYWDAYNPPAANYRAAYLHQLSPRQTLFGWLYNDGTDDIGRAHTPYFISYYLAGDLGREQLERILNCLTAGPLAAIERQHLPPALDRLAIPNPCSYEPARPGIEIPRTIQQQSQRQLLQQQLLQLFIPLEVTQNEKVADQSVKFSPPAIAGDSSPEKPGNRAKIEQILRELAAQPLEIQGAALLIARPEERPLVISLGLEEKMSLMLSEPMLALARSSPARDKLKWQAIEQISARSPAGQVILARCHGNAFLLVKAGKALAGLLESEINRTVKKLQRHL